MRVPIVLLSAVLLCGVASAQEKKGAPPELIGKYGSSPAACQSYHRKSDGGLQEFFEDEWDSCGGSACGATIVSHKRTPDGFVLKLKSWGNPKGWTQAFKKLEGDMFEMPASKGRPPTLLVRCTVKDAIAGIGKEPNTEDYGSQAMPLVFSALYARHVPEHCPGLEVDNKAVERLALMGQVGWVEFIRKGKYPTQGRNLVAEAESLAKSSGESAASAVRLDAQEIPNFCREVLDAFGAGGRVIPDLISDPRKKA